MIFLLPIFFIFFSQAFANDAKDQKLETDALIAPALLATELAAPNVQNPLFIIDAAGDRFQLSGIRSQFKWLHDRHKQVFAEIVKKWDLATLVKTHPLFPNKDITGNWHILFPAYPRKSYQEELLEAGLAFYFFEKDFDPLMQARFIKAEKTARENGKGLWQKPNQFYFLAHQPKKIALYRFGLVEGLLHAITKTKNGVYLNFGPDYKTDFTAFFPGHVWRNMRPNLRKQLKKGIYIEMRGYVRNYNGPFMNLRHQGDWKTLQTGK